MRIESVIPDISPAENNSEGNFPAAEPLSKAGVYCERVMEWSLLAIVVLAPSFFSLLNADIFDLPKIALTRLFTFAVIAAWLFKILFAGRFRQVRTAIDLPLLIYLGLVTITSLVNLAPISSLIGDNNRDDGVLAIINYGLIFWMAVNVYQNREQVWRAVRWQVVIAAGIAAYGVAQMFNIGTFGDFWVLWPGGRAASTLGHPAFLSTYLGMMLPMGLLLVGRPRSSRERAIWIALSVVMLAGLILTYGRSGWLGLMAALAFISIALGWYKQLRNRTVLLVSGTVLIIALGYFFALPAAMPNAPRLPGQFSVKDRVQQMIFEPGNDVRIFYWRGTVEMIKENWLLGVGMANFQGSFMKFTTLEYARGEGLHASPDKAHNEYLHIAAVSGVPALLSYLWFLGGFAWLVAVKWRVLRGDPLATTLVGAAIANAVAVSFLFNSVGEAPVFWWAMAAVVVLIGIDGKFAREIKQRIVPSNTVANFGGVAVLIVFLLLSYYLVYCPVVADYYEREADVLISKKVEQAPSLERYSEDQLSNVTTGHVSGHSASSFLDSVRLYKQAVMLWPYRYNYWDKYASALQIAGATVPSREESFRNLDEGISAASQSIRLNPMNPGGYLLRGEIYVAYGDEHAKDALSDFQTAVLLGPFYLNAQIAMAQFASTHNLLNEEIASNRRIVEIQPDNYDAWYNLGLGYTKAGRYPAAENAYMMVLKGKPTDVQANFALGATYFKMGRKDDAERQLLRILELDPENADVVQALSVVRGEHGGSPKE